MKKLFAILLAVAIGVAVAGCNGGTDEPETPGPTTTTDDDMDDTF